MITRCSNITSKSLKKLVFLGCVDPNPDDEIDIGYDIRFVVNNWIRFTVRCNAEELDLRLWSDTEEIVDKYQLDQHLFTGSCFTDLKLSVEGCKINTIGAFSWKNLMNLRISYAELDEDSIENILCGSGSPELETLVLKDCYGYRRLDITSKSLKNLVLCGYIDPASDDYIIEINAPYILSLTIEYYLYLWKLVLLNVSSLLKANLNYVKALQFQKTYDYDDDEEAEEEMLKLMLDLLHVKELKVGVYCSEVMSRLEAKGFVFPSNIKYTTKPRHGTF